MERRWRPRKGRLIWAAIGGREAVPLVYVGRSAAHPAYWRVRGVISGESFDAIAKHLHATEVDARNEVRHGGGGK